MEQPPTRDEVLAWLRAHRPQGFRQAGKHFELPSEVVKQLVARPLVELQREWDAEDDPAAPDPEAPALDEIARLTQEALTRRLRWLATEASVGSKGERDCAIATGILIDKWARVVELARDADGPVDGDGPAAREAAAGRVRSAMGIDPGRGDSS